MMTFLSLVRVSLMAVPGWGKRRNQVSGLRNLWLEMAFVQELADLLADEDIERERAGEG